MIQGVCREELRPGIHLHVITRSREPRFRSHGSFARTRPGALPHFHERGLIGIRPRAALDELIDAATSSTSSENVPQIMPQNDSTLSGCSRCCFGSKSSGMFIIQIRRTRKAVPAQAPGNGGTNAARYIGNDRDLAVLHDHELGSVDSISRVGMTACRAAPFLGVELKNPVSTPTPGA
jgi:hypothetical protein